MDRISVDSSNLASVGYELETNTLEIEFKKSGIYQYFNVPEQVYNELMTAGSHGQYFSYQIKPHYSYQKVG
ncbi:KTSC domain-containing protein [Orbus sasakiae]|uniref:KTSC domain-containing protein n=1 Tax=Orbus sasakiae TaxID=1078475 RepID=A0ABP9N0H9_9GAMM